MKICIRAHDLGASGIDQVVEKSKFFISMFSNHNEVEISWAQIEKIGEDVILVKIIL